MTTLRARDRNINGHYVSAGMVEDDYGDESWSGHAYQKQPKFEHKQRGEDGPCVVYRESEVTDNASL